MRLYIVILIAAVLYTVSATEQKSRDGLETELEKERTRRVLLEENYYTIVTRLDGLTTKLTEYSTDVTNLKQTVAKLTHSTVAFKAHLQKSFTPLPNQLIDFDNVQFNLGNAYHAGTFIAPLNGTYMFSVSMCSYSGHWIVVDLQRNGILIGQVLAGDSVYRDCSSETTITELNAGDAVNVYHHGNSGDKVFGDNEDLNSFTGVLLNLRVP